MKNSTTKKRLFGVLLALLTVVSMMIPAGAVQAAAKPKVKVTTTMSASNKMYMGASKALNVKTNVASTVTYKTSNSSIAAVKSGKLCAYKPGSVTVKVSAKPKSGKYQTGTVSFTVDVLPKKPGGLSASRSGSKINVSVNAVKGATGYQFVYATNSEFSGYKRITTKKTSGSFSASDSKTYYVKARSYAAVNGKNYYSGWSTVKKVNASSGSVPSGAIKKIDIHSYFINYHNTLKFDGVEEGPKTIRPLINKSPYSDYQKYLKWKSSDTNVVTVSLKQGSYAYSDCYDGCITPVGEGTCTVTVSSPDGTVSDSIQVVVKKIDTDIKSITVVDRGGEESANHVTLVSTKDILQLVAYVPSFNVNEPYNKCPVKWKSSNPSVATVKSDSLYPQSANIYAKGNGTCTITAYSKNNSSVKATYKVTVDVINGSADPHHPYIQELADRVNIERVKAGVPEVVLDEKITRATMVRAKEYAILDDHIRPDGRPISTALDEAGVHYGYAAENAAITYGYPFHAMNAWMSSPGHKANILNPSHRRLGIGLYITPGTSDRHWIQIFTD